MRYISTLIKINLAVFASTHIGNEGENLIESLPSRKILRSNFYSNGKRRKMKKFKHKKETYRNNNKRINGVPFFISSV
jgi:hypothetical protein